MKIFSLFPLILTNALQIVNENELRSMQKLIPFINAPYCVSGLLTWSCKPCLNIEGTTNVSLIGDERDVFGYSAIHFKSKMIIFGFRGTRNLKNWINNLMIARPNAPFPSAPANARIHYGFLADYQKVGDQFTDMFKKYVKEFPDFDIKIMGHSLGGALALLGTVDLITHNLLPLNKTTIYTIGMPRVGNQVWANWTESLIPKHQFLRVVNENDLTPHLPPDFSGFQHSGLEIWISDSTHTYNCSSKTLESDECANSIQFSWNIAKHGTAWGIVIGHKSCYDSRILSLQI